MKNILLYFYNIKIDTFNQKNKNYYFSFSNEDYCFMLCNDNIEINYYLNSLLYNYINIYIIIKNNNNQLYTMYDNNQYILLKLNKQKEYNLNDILVFQNYYYPIKELQVPNWKKLWENKVDYLEYQMNHISNNSLIKESFNYYIGLAENAINILNYVGNNVNFSISHKRINNLFDLYNPLNLIIDIRVRDACEYFKNRFFNNYNILDELKFYLNNNLTDDEQKLFLARMMFPTYYFDLIEEIIGKKIKENELKKIVSKANEYEKILHTIYLAFQNNLYIKWIDEII